MKKSTPVNPLGGKTKYIYMKDDVKDMPNLYLMGEYNKSFPKMDIAYKKL